MGCWMGWMLGGIQGRQGKQQTGSSDCLPPPSPVCVIALILTPQSMSSHTDLLSGSLLPEPPSPSLSPA